MIIRFRKLLFHCLPGILWDRVSPSLWSCVQHWCDWTVGKAVQQLNSAVQAQNLSALGAGQSQAEPGLSNLVQPSQNKRGGFNPWYRKYIHTYIHTIYIHACMHTANTCMHAYMGEDNTRCSNIACGKCKKDYK